MGDKSKAVELAESKEMLKRKLVEIEEKEKQIEEAKVKSVLGLGSEANKAPDVITSHTRMGSYEQKLLKTFGAKGFQDLIAVNTCHPTYRHVKVEDKLAVQQLKEVADISRYMAQIFHGGAKDNAAFQDRPAEVKTMLNSYYAKEHLVPLIKSFNSGVASTGGAWVPTIISSSYQEEYELEFLLAGRTQVMPMQSGNPFQLPVSDSVTTARLIAEGATMNDSNFTTSVIEWDAKKTGEYYILPTELDEDSAPPILAIARGEVTRAQIRAREQVLVNGDDSGSHMDSDVTAADDARKLAKGYRKLSLDNTATVDFSGTVSVNKLDEMRISMGKLGVNVKELAYVFGPTGYGQAVSLEAVSSVDQIGNAATLVTGSLAAFRGVPIIISEFVREDLNATGVYDGTTTDKTVCHIVNGTRFWIGVRRPIMTKIAVSDPEEDTMKMASYSRWDFKGHAQDATETSSVLGFNISLV